MMDVYRTDDSQEVRTWEQRFCNASSCKESILYVQRCDERPELWRVAVKPDKDVWLVAALAPICPFCGGNLLTPANLDNGVQELSEYRVSVLEDKHE